ncbi:MAG TPA: hypothetical protein VIK61_10005, partial [Acidimicrobiia bacterium]
MFRSTVRVLSIAVLVGAGTAGRLDHSLALTTYEQCNLTGRGTFATPLDSTTPIQWDRIRLKGKLTKCSGTFQGSFPFTGKIKAYQASCASPGSEP